MSGLSSKSNLLLCGMQGIKGYLRKRRKITNITYTAIRFLLLTSAKFAVRAVKCLKNIKKEFLIFNSSFNGFIMRNR